MSTSGDRLTTSAACGSGVAGPGAVAGGDAACPPSRLASIEFSGKSTGDFFAVMTTWMIPY
jgi:hypothetical protein